MSRKRRHFTREFKLKVLRELEAGKSLAHPSREYDIHPSLISKWRKQHREYGEEGFVGNGNLYKYEAKTWELERMVGKLTMKNEVLKKALRRLEQRVRLNKGSLEK